MFLIGKCFLLEGQTPPLSSGSVIIKLRSEDLRIQRNLERYIKWVLDISDFWSICTPMYNWCIIGLHIFDFSKWQTVFQSEIWFTLSPTLYESSFCSYCLQIFISVILMGVAVIFYRVLIYIFLIGGEIMHIFFGYLDILLCKLCAQVCWPFFHDLSFFKLFLLYIFISWRASPLTLFFKCLGHC